MKIFFPMTTSAKSGAAKSYRNEGNSVYRSHRMLGKGVQGHATDGRGSKFNGDWSSNYKFSLLAVFNLRHCRYQFSLPCCAQSDNKFDFTENETYNKAKDLDTLTDDTNDVRHIISILHDEVRQCKRKMTTWCPKVHFQPITDRFHSNALR